MNFNNTNKAFDRRSFLKAASLGTLGAMAMPNSLFADSTKRAIRIDSHQHFWPYSKDEYAWIDDSMKAIAQDFAPSDLFPHLNKNGFDGCVAVQVRTSLIENDYFLKIAEQNPWVKGVVGWVDLTASNVKEQLAPYKNNEKFVGIREILQAREPDFMLRKDFLKGVELLHEEGLTYDILIKPHHLDATLEFVKHFPEHKLVIDHIAKPEISAKGPCNEWMDKMAELATHKNVHCKLSGMVTESVKPMSRSWFKAFGEHALKVFGEDRLMYGSDWPVCKLMADYDEVVAIAEDCTSSLKPSAKDKVFGLNAMKFYGLK